MRLLLLGLHGAFGWANYLFWTVVAGAFIALTALNPFDRVGRGGAAALGLVWGRVMWWATPFWWRSWAGLEHLGDGPYVIVANHQSTIDIPCLFGLPLPVKISARPGIFRVPVMGPFLRWSGQVDTDHFLEQGREALEAGISVVVFPEGSRSPDGSVRRFRAGAFRLAVETGVPLLPVAIDRSRFIMAKKRYWPTQPVVVVAVRVLEPISAVGADPKALARAARTAIEAALARAREAP